MFNLKGYHIFFLLLKLGIILQFVLILTNKEKVDSDVYILTEIIFKTCLGMFIEVFMFHRDIPGLEIEDKVIISFAGGLLLFDAWANDLPILLRRYNLIQ